MMSFKAVDMSFAVHKNADVGQLQREIQQKPQVDQLALAQGQQQTAEGARKRTEGLKETDKSAIRNKQEEKKRRQGSTAQASQEASDPSSSQTPAQAEHPYKGHHVDVSL